MFLALLQLFLNQTAIVCTLTTAPPSMEHMLLCYYGIPQYTNDLLVRAPLVQTRAVPLHVFVDMSHVRSKLPLARTCAGGHVAEHLPEYSGRRTEILSPSTVISVQSLVTPVLQLAPTRGKRSRANMLEEANKKFGENFSTTELTAWQKASGLYLDKLSEPQIKTCLAP